MNENGHPPARNIRHDEKGRPYVHYTDLLEKDESDHLYREWNTYRREIARLLAEGHEGKVAVIHGDTILGLFDNWVMALVEAERFRPLQPLMGQQIREREPIVPDRRDRPQCPVLHSPWIPTASSSPSVGELIERLPREGAAGSPEQREGALALVKAVHAEAVERLRGQPMSPPPEPPSIHYTELPEPQPDSSLRAEWNTYRREAGRLLGEGHEGKFVLVKGELIVGLFESREAAYREGLQRYSSQPFLVKQLLTREPLLRLRGYNRPWPASLSQPDVAASRSQS